MGMRIPAAASMTKQGSLLFGGQKKEKAVVVMGATGSGKTRLSMDLATHFASEIINADKMQLYEGLDVVTNKIPAQQRRGVPHHLLGVLSPRPHLDFPVSSFCGMASLAADSIVRRRRLPIIVGGSNSHIEALVGLHEFGSRYECCFLWVDVGAPVLHSFVSERVDRMVAGGLVEEVRGLFDPDDADYSRGVRKAIGVPELDRYFRRGGSVEELLEEAVGEIKANTCELACRQRDKIRGLGNVKGWRIHRLDATEAFRKKGKEAEEAWTNHVAAPSTIIVAHFLTQPNNNNNNHLIKPMPFRFRMPLNPTPAAPAP